MTTHGLDDGKFVQTKTVGRVSPTGVPLEEEGSNTLKDLALEARSPAYSIVPLLYARWSPRAMTGESLTKSELHRLLEAARWAPSTYNEQEWRYLYARREHSTWSLFFDCLTDANRTWCENAAVLILIAGKRNLSGGSKGINPVRSFDCGASFQNLALQGIEMGLVVHGMAGFETGKAMENLKIPDEYAVEAMVAVGRPAPPSALPEELARREKPSDRKPIEEISCEGVFCW